MNDNHLSDSRIDALLDSAAPAVRARRIAVRREFADRVTSALSLQPRRSTRRAALFIVGSAVTVTAVVATTHAVLQQIPVHTLSAPIAEFREPFSGVRGLRELSNGRVIVNDYREQFVKLADFASGTLKTLGAHGNGPGEYMMPLLLIPLGSDTTAVYDMADAGDLNTIRPDGSMVGSITATTTQPGAAMINVRSRGDGRGYIYSETRTGNDSIAVERLDRRSNRRDVLAYVSPLGISPLLNRPRGGSPSGAVGAPTGGAGMSGPPFMTSDQWAVSGDGRIAVVTVQPYRVSFTEADGRRWTADPIPFTRIRVSEGHKAEWREAQARPVAGLWMDPGGVQSVRFTARPVADPPEWPDFLPPFLRNAVSFASNGMLWVKRTTAAGAPETYDVIDNRGRLVLKVVFPPRTSLAGFGANVVYALRRDNDDLEYLQKFRLP